MNEEKLLKIEIAIDEARKFIQTANGWKRHMTCVPGSRLTGCKEGGACKRASMDLTRSLAELRK